MAYILIAIGPVVGTFSGAVAQVGDIVVMASGAIGTPGGADLPENISAPSASVVVGNGGGSGLGNQSMAPNITRWVPGDTTSVIAGVVVGWGPITLYQAKNGFQYAPAAIECWAFVETDPSVVMAITMPAVPATEPTEPVFDLKSM